jgi:uncharacterized protein YndB with AHSA1/START domain
MSQFLKSGDFAYHVSGSYTPVVDKHSVVFSSTFGGSKNPTDHNKVLSLNLSKSELSDLIKTLKTYEQNFQAVSG